MQHTLEIDGKLLEGAKKFTCIEDTDTILRAGLKALVEREAARRLARLGGSCPDLKMPRRRRLKPHIGVIPANP